MELVPGFTELLQGLSATMQELDHIMTRPSIEHKLEAEHQTLRREDDNGTV